MPCWPPRRRSPTLPDVELTKTGLNPKTVTVEAGNAVSFKNSDTVQHAVVVDKTTCNLALQPQQSSSCTFATPGTFTYGDPASKDKTFDGTVTVTPAVQRSVTLSANRNIAIFGDSVTLSGATSTKTAGETVTVYVRARPASRSARIAVPTTTNGAWSLRVQPRVNTEYQVQYGDVHERQARRRASARGSRSRRSASNKFLIVVLSNKALAGQTVAGQRATCTARAGCRSAARSSAAIARTDSIAVKTVTELFPSGTKLER